MKKTGRCLIIGFIAILVAFGGVYFVRTANIALGSNTYYYREIFDYPGTEWVCEEPQITLKVYDLEKTPLPELGYIGTTRCAIMKVETDGAEQDYVMTGGHGSLEIYWQERREGEIIDNKKVFQGRAKYRKSFSTKDLDIFTIYDIEQDEIFRHAYEKLVFRP